MNRMLYLRLLWKKIRDRKLKEKIRLAFLLIAGFAILGIGIFSYQVAKNELIRNSGQAVLELERQGGKSLEERKKAFEESSYRILQMANLEKILNYSRQKALALKTRNEGLPAAIMQQNLLYKYTEFALLRPNSGVIYDFYRNERERLGEEEAQALLDRLDEMVSRHQPARWVSYEGKDYFIRKAIDMDLNEKGVLIFCIKDHFFSYIEEQLPYLEGQQEVVCNEEGQVLLGRSVAHLDLVLEKLAAMDWSAGNDAQYEEGDYIISIVHSKESSWDMAICYSKSLLLVGVNHIASAIAVFLLAAAGISLLLAEFFSHTITRNTVVLEKGMQEFEKGNFRYRISPSSYDEVGLLGLQLNYMAEQIEQLMDLQKASEQKKRQMEIATLQAQINPHFLYNTLGSWKWSAFRAGQKQLSDSLDALVKLLRFTIKRAAGMVSVREEIDYIKSYVAIEKMRYEDQFAMVYEIEETTLEMQLPGFVLQPLVENSLLHGLDMTKEDAGIWIRTMLREKDGTQYLILEEEDNGIGMTSEVRHRLLFEEAEEKKQGFSSIGVQIVNRRLAEIYGELYHMELVSAPGCGTRITLWIPFAGFQLENYER